MIRFLVDAQLPARLAEMLSEAGYDALHTRDLPAGNRSTDAAICDRADREGRVVVTKDADFAQSHVLTGTPARLLLVSTGNIRNAELLDLVRARLSRVVELFGTTSFLEMTWEYLVIHEGSGET